MPPGGAEQLKAPKDGGITPKKEERKDGTPGVGKPPTTLNAPNGPEVVPGARAESFGRSPF
jgi:hypothetical protein